MSGEYMEVEEEFVTRRDRDGNLYVTNVPQTSEQITLIERVRMAAPDLACDVAMVINELNRLRMVTK